MGMYLNPGEDAFCEAVNSPIYVDKSELLSYTNSVFKTAEKYVCVSRPRRFGKSMAANMVSAYYDRTADADAIFAPLKIAQHDDFAKHRGKYDVIKLNIQDFLSCADDMDSLLLKIQQVLLRDLMREYPDNYFNPKDLREVMADIYARTKRPFVIVIDEWDCVFREYTERKDWQEKYLDFLRAWLKDKTYVGLAYMTGILPIKKYGTHSALNMFAEFSMIEAGMLAEFVGFTESEVKDLCKRYNMDLEMCKTWYDGYRFDEIGSIYSPRSVVQSMRNHKYGTYWNRTETFEALKIYIDLDYDGLREAIIALMSGAERRIETVDFANDMKTFRDADDVLTLLIHLGYLGYDNCTKSVFIPNQEIRYEYANAVRGGGWDKIALAIKTSEQLMQATLSMDADAVAKGIEAAHIETSHLQYNDENALSYTISLAYYTARQKYLPVREFPAGKGFADIVFLPRPHYASLPALIIELKWDVTVKAAISQIQEKNYPKSLEDYTGSVLLVGINYDKTSKNHECEIIKHTKVEK